MIAIAKYDTINKLKRHCRTDNPGETPFGSDEFEGLSNEPTIYLYLTPFFMDDKLEDSY
jgi:hypothetical protein